MLDVYFFDLRQRWRSLAQVAQEPLKRCLGAVNLDFDLAVRVPHPPCQLVSLGQLIDERTEPDTLDDPPNFDAKTVHPPRSP